MMYQRDYILRLIEQLGLLIAAILRFIKKGDPETAREQLENLYYEMLKRDAGFFAMIPEDELTQKLLEEHNYTNGHLEILAELFNVQAELELSEGKKDKALEYSRKALLLFEFVDREYRTYSQSRLDKIETIKNRIINL